MLMERLVLAGAPDAPILTGIDMVRCSAVLRRNDGGLGLPGHFRGLNHFSVQYRKSSRANLSAWIDGHFRGYVMRVSDLSWDQNGEG
jgi:hypothetical protein